MLDWLETSAVAIWVGQSPSIWAMPTILTLHTTGMAVLVGASWVLDLRLLGVVRHVPLSAFRWVFPVLAIGLIVNVVTGVLLFTKNATVWGTSIPFLVKMSLVIASVAVLVPIRSLVARDRTPDGRAPGAGPAGTRTATGNGRLLAMASIALWCGAVTAGRLLAYVLP
jgi:hypothetical protein